MDISGATATIKRSRVSTSPIMNSPSGKIIRARRISKLVEDDMDVQRLKQERFLTKLPLGAVCR